MLERRILPHLQIRHVHRGRGRIDRRPKALKRISAIPCLITLITYAAHSLSPPRLADRAEQKGPSPLKTDTPITPLATV